MPVDEIPVVMMVLVSGSGGGGLEVQPDGTARAAPVVAERATANRRSDPEFFLEHAKT